MYVNFSTFLQHSLIAESSPIWITFKGKKIFVMGRQIEAHKVVLAKGSRVFNKILTLNPQSQPLIFLSDVKFSYMLNILDFMYQGEVSIDKEELDEFLAVARDLKINGLMAVSYTHLTLPTILLV